MAGRTVPQRFLDVGDEPDRWFIGIQDYDKCPLVSLKQAIEPIKSFLPEVDSMIEITERNCRKPADKLTPDESGAIHLYTMPWPQPHPSLSTLLNERLRSKNRNALTSWYLFLKLFFTALYKLPSMKETIWRGARGNLSEHYDVDHVWWGVSSCMETMNIVETFLGSEGIRTIFQIECLFGKSLQSHSALKEENEILLMPGSYFQVIAKWQAGKDLHLIQLREKPAPYPTVTPPFDRPISPVNKPAIFAEKKNLSNSNNTMIRSSEQRKKWKQKGISVVGENGQGHRLDQLSRCEGICLDEEQSVFIADCENHRVVQWKFRSKNGQTIADNHRKRNSNERLNSPVNILLDQRRHSIIISDRGHRRVLRCSGRYKDNQEILIKDIDCWGLAFDHKGFLYVSDYEKNEVRRWKIGQTIGTLVAGGNGEGLKLNQLSGPTYIFVDKNESIYISDSFNHRIMKWKKNAKEGIVVAGGNESGNEPEQLSYPKGIVVDQLGHIYIADWGNNRVMRWVEGDSKGSNIVGGNGNGKESNQLTYPTGLAFDQQGNLYVADSLNYRIQMYQIDSD